MDIRPIHTDEDHRAALVEIERLWDAPEGSDDAAKLDILATLVEHYEDERWPTAEPKWTPVDVLRYAIDEMGHSQAELGKLLGSRSRASEILAPKRLLTLEMIRCIYDAWKIPAQLLIGSYRIKRSSRPIHAPPRARLKKARGLSPARSH